MVLLCMNYEARVWLYFSGSKIYEVCLEICGQSPVAEDTVFKIEKGVVPESNGRWGDHIYEKHHEVWLGTFNEEIEATRYPAINKPAGVVHWVKHSKDAQNLVGTFLRFALGNLRAVYMQWLLTTSRIMGNGTLAILV
ncbi:hypothetical protein L1887_16713 [Cichorium endivia]|nr:hypothetical protein L1887_16713 [Cichorium endivia]